MYQLIGKKISHVWLERKRDNILFYLDNGGELLFEVEQGDQWIEKVSNLSEILNQEIIDIEEYTHGDQLFSTFVKTVYIIKTDKTQAKIKVYTFSEYIPEFTPKLFLSPIAPRRYESYYRINNLNYDDTVDHPNLINRIKNFFKGLKCQKITPIA